MSTDTDYENPWIYMERGILLIVAMFMTIMVLFIILPISSTNDSTLGESIFGSIERLKERNEK